MSSGFLSIETHPDHPDRVRCVQHDSQPSTERTKTGANVQYIVRYNNIFRGYQQVQGALSKRIIDIDQGLFRVNLLEAITAIESAPLKAERVWIDPTLTPDFLEQLQLSVSAVKSKKKQMDMLWKMVGFSVVFLLFLRAFSGAF